MMIRSICAALAACALAACGAGHGTQFSPVLRLRADGAGLRMTSAQRWTYSGTIVQSTNGVVQRGSVTETIVAGNAPDPYATPAGASDFHATERDTFAAGTISYSTDLWQGQGPAANGERPVLLYATREADNAGNAFWERYPVARTIDETPESAGAAWSNGASAVYHQSDRDGTVVDSNVAAGGSYDESVGYAYGCALMPCSLSVSVAPNGSATYRGNALAGAGIAAIALGAPNARGIAAVVTFANGARQRRTIPAWFAAGAPLYAENDSVRAATLPASCHLPPSLGTAATVVTLAISRIDPAQGITETQQLQSFQSPAYGTVCAMLSDRVEQRYDLATLRFEGHPLFVRTLTETLGLKSTVFGRAAPRMRAIQNPAARVGSL